MKIIKYGEGYPIKIVCVECKSTLEVELGDIKTYTECFVLKREHTKYIICPVCGKDNVIKKEIVEYQIGRQ